MTCVALALDEIAREGRGRLRSRTLFDVDATDEAAVEKDATEKEERREWERAILLSLW